MKTVKQAIAFILFAVIIFTSNYAIPQFKNLGIKTGINLSNTDLKLNSSSAETINRTGFNITLFYSFFKFKNASISTEMGYSQKGYKNKILLTNELGETIGVEFINNKLDYFDLSLIGKVFLETTSINPYLSAGPVIGIYAGHNTSLTVSGYDGIISQNNEMLGNMKRTTFGIKFGAGVEIKKVISNSSIIVETRYNRDLSNSKDNDISSELKNRLIEFNLGIQF